MTRSNWLNACRYCSRDAIPGTSVCREHRRASTVQGEVRIYHANGWSVAALIPLRVLSGTYAEVLAWIQQHIDSSAIDWRGEE